MNDVCAEILDEGSSDEGGSGDESGSGDSSDSEDDNEKGNKSFLLFDPHGIRKDVIYGIISDQLAMLASCVDS